MKRILFFILICTMVLCSCTRGGISELFSDDNDLADKRMEQLFAALEQKSEADVVAIFSKDAISKVENINASVAALFDFIKGNVSSWERDESSVVLQDTESGMERKKLTTWYRLNTTEQVYLVFLVDYPIDQINADNQGLYTLKIIRQEDEASLQGTVEDWTLAGITIG